MKSCIKILQKGDAIFETKKDEKKKTKQKQKQKNQLLISKK